MNTFFRKIGVKFPVIATTGIFAHTGYIMYQQALCVEKECIKHSYYGNLKTPLDDNTQKVVDAVFDKIILQATPKQCALTNFYWSNKPTIHCVGSTLSRFGTYVGIPIHFGYQSSSEVDLSDLESRLEETSTNKELLMKLRELYMLSPSAKKFAIASEFLTAHSFQLVVQGGSVVWLFVGFAILKSAFQPLLESGPPHQIGKLFVALTGFLFVVHCKLSHKYFNYLQLSSDKSAVKFGEDYLDGGIEYLQKLIEKNKVLRELDPSSKLLFQPNGDYVQSVFSIPRVTLNQRLTNLENIKKKKQEAKNSNSEDSQDNAPA